MQPSYEIFDHTADAGIRVRASTLAELLMPAAQGLYAVIGDLAATDVTQRISFDMHDAEVAVLLRDYLGELLILWERDKRIATSLENPVFDANGLSVTVHAAIVDDERSDYHREVKAITYHELEIKMTPEGCEATLIVDI